MADAAGQPAAGLPAPSAAEDHLDEHGIEMPRPTVWPMSLALGLTLFAGGLMTSWLVGLCGLVISFWSLGAWIRELLPGRGEFHMPLVPPDERVRPIEPRPEAVAQLRSGMAGHRMRMPEQIHPYSAGAKGGAVGAVAMAVPALLYGYLMGHGIWYPVNLLAAMLMPAYANSTIAELEQFSLTALILGTVIHLVTSIGVGLIYGVMLPTLPRRPVLWAGVIAPLLWTSFIYAFMGVLNPTMAKYVDWPWFIVSQFAYGLTVGVVVVRTEKVYVEELRKKRREKKAAAQQEAGKDES